MLSQEPSPFPALQVPKGQPIVLLHLSDAHLCPTLTGWDAERVLDPLVLDLSSMEREFGLQPSLIIFSGDIVFGQLPSSTITDQFKYASSLLKRIRTSFTRPIPLSNIFVVPGNHDVDRTKVNAGDTNWLDDLFGSHPDQAHDEVNNLLQRMPDRWTSIAQRLRGFGRFLEDAGLKHLIDPSARFCGGHIRQLSGHRLGIVTLNSSWSSCRRQEKGKLWLGRWQIGAALQSIKGADFSLALCHHPINWLNHLEDPLILREIENSFDFFMHGHEHDAWVREVPRPGRGTHVTVAAGACYDSSSRENGYSFIRIFPVEDRVEIFMRRYEASGGAWVPRIIPGRTDKEGCWKIEPMGWVDRTGKGGKELTLARLQLFYNFHTARQESVLAADVCSQAIDQSKELQSGQTRRAWGQRLRQELSKELRQDLRHRSYFSKLIPLWHTGAGASAQLSLSPFLIRLLKDLEQCRRTIDFLESHSQSNPLESIYVSTILGRSPSRRSIATALEGTLSRLKSSADGSLHQGCLICTATAIIEFILAGQGHLVGLSIQWLKSQAANKWRDSKTGLLRIQYAAIALDALLLAREYTVAENLAREILENQTEWEAGLERDGLESRAQILYSLGEYLRISKRFLKANHLLGLFCDAVSTFITPLPDSPGPRLALSLRGLLVADLIPDEQLRVTLSELAEDAFLSLVEDPRWDQATGGWGNDLVETMYRLYSRLSYWEYLLHIYEI